VKRRKQKQEKTLKGSTNNIKNVIASNITLYGGLAAAMRQCHLNQINF